MAERTIVRCPSEPRYVLRCADDPRLAVRCRDGCCLAGRSVRIVGDCVEPVSVRPDSILTSCVLNIDPSLSFGPLLINLRFASYANYGWQTSMTGVGRRGLRIYYPSSPSIDRHVGGLGAVDLSPCYVFSAIDEWVFLGFAGIDGFPVVGGSSLTREIRVAVQHRAGTPHDDSVGLITSCDEFFSMHSADIRDPKTHTRYLGRVHHSRGGKGYVQPFFASRPFPGTSDITAFLDEPRTGVRSGSFSSTRIYSTGTETQNPVIGQRPPSSAGGTDFELGVSYEKSMEDLFAVGRFNGAGISGRTARLTFDVETTHGINAVLAIFPLRPTAGTAGAAQRAPLNLPHTAAGGRSWQATVTIPVGCTDFGVMLWTVNRVFVPWSEEGTVGRTTYPRTVAVSRFQLREIEVL